MTKVMVNRGVSVVARKRSNIALGRRPSITIPPPITFIFASFFGASPLADGVTNRLALQAAIDYASARNLDLLTQPGSSGTYTISTDSSGRGLNFPSNTSIRSITSEDSIFNFVPATNFKTSNFSGGTIPADQVRAITIDNSVSSVNNITLQNITFTTPRVKWYDGSNYLQTIPICIYFNNTNQDFDYTNGTPEASNYNFVDCTFENFQRGSLTVRGRKINDVNFIRTDFLNISTEDLEYPTESRYIYTNVLVDGLLPSTTSYDFNVSNGIAYTVILYNGADMLYTIPYVTTAANASIGSITNNPMTAGLVQWTVNASVLASTTSISVHCIRRTTDATGAPSLNGVACDASNIDGLTILNGVFTGCADQFSHYVYQTRRSDNITISGNTFTGRGVKSVQSGGGVHIRGAAYNDITITDNTFTNVRGHNINLSSVTDATVTGNTMNWDYDQNSLGSVIDFTYGALHTLNYSGNTINANNTFLPASVAIAYNVTDTDGINIKSNFYYGNIENVAPLSKGVNFWNNTVIGSSYTTNNRSLIVMSHNNVSDVLDISFKNNSFTFGVPGSAQPLVQGFTGFTWDNNTISPSVNVFRFGDSVKLRNLTIGNSTINSLRLNCDGTTTINNLSTVVSYISDSVYTDMVKNTDVVCSNITDLGTQPRTVASGAINIINTGLVNITIPAPGDLEYLFFRTFDNVNLPYERTLHNSSSHTINCVDFNNSVAGLKNFDNAGVNFSWLAGTDLTLRLDKVNARWIKV